jgi:phosphatidylinositol glycan class V
VSIFFRHHIAIPFPTAMGTADPERDGSSLVLRCAVASRVATLVAGLLFDALIPDYDTSTRLLDSPHGALPTTFLHWDAVYFLHLCENGLDYDFEHFAAFFPGYPLLARCVASSLLYPMDAFLGHRAACAVAALLLSNVAFIFAALLLYRLTLEVLADRSVALTSALLFCIGPAAVFMSAAYTESCFACLGFAGMLAWTKGRPWLATLLFTAAATTRSNGILLAGFFLYDALHHLAGPPPRAIWPRPLSIALDLARAAMVCAPYVMFQWAVHSLYCSSPTPSEWCASGPFALYGHVQSKYWGVGFLRYYQWKQLPNFLLAAPTLLLCASGLVGYLQRDWKTLLTGGLCPSRSERGARLVPFVGYLLVQVVFALLVMHIQVVTRFVSGTPMFYWSAAHSVLKHGPVKPSFFTHTPPT